MNSWDDVWPYATASERIALELCYLKQFVTGSFPHHMLDVGGNTFFDAFQASSVRYDMIDLAVPLESGEGGHNPHPEGFQFDGTHLPFAPHSYDSVIMGFVLHHAAHHSLPLLEQAKKITRDSIVILEDLAQLDYPREWHDRNHRHQPGGIYRSDQEWRFLFSLLGLKLVRSIKLEKAEDPDARPYRALYHLRATG